MNKNKTTIVFNMVFNMLVARINKQTLLNYTFSPSVWKELEHEINTKVSPSFIAKSNHPNHNEDYKANES